MLWIIKELNMSQSTLLLIIEEVYFQLHIDSYITLES